MTDVVVTVAKGQWPEWVQEGDLPGEEWTGREYNFYIGRLRPRISAGERVYIVAHGKLRGFAPLARIDPIGVRYALVRRGQAQAVTIVAPILGFQGWRYRWWNREDETPFPDWRTP